jgi:hypothetical protein
LPAGVSTIEFTCTAAGKVNAFPTLLELVSIGTMRLLLEQAVPAVHAGPVLVVTRTVLSTVPVIVPVTTLSLKTGCGGTKPTLHSGGRHAAVISVVPGAEVPTEPRLTLANAGCDENQLTDVVLLSGTPLLSVTMGVSVNVDPTGALNEVLVSVADFWI